MSTKQTFAEKKEAATKAVEDMHAALAGGLDTDADWAQYLRFVGRLHSYSIQNTMLMWAQWEQRRQWRRILRGIQAAFFGAPIFDEMPPMTHCAAFSKWEGMGGQVIKDEKALHVLAPVIVKDKENLNAKGQPRDKCIGFVLKNRTFEISQFAGIEAPPEPVQLLLGEGPEGLWDHLVALAEHLGFTVEIGDSGDANGFCNYSTKQIVVSSRNEGLQQTKTLIHEIGHAMLHGPDDRPKFMPQAIAEVEAESVAYTVANLAGFDSSDYSFGYVGTWSRGDGALIAATLERVANCAARIAEFVESGTLPDAKRAASKFEFEEFFTEAA
jgi:hypothetical protein